MDTLASQYIDNELDLDEKVLFVDRIHSQPRFYADARDLLQQERLLRQLPDTALLPVRPPETAGAGSRLYRLMKPLLYSAAGFAAAGLLFFSLMTTRAPQPPVNRFVIYEPDARQVELAGSFTGWQRQPMQSVGDSGYWELILRVPVGEHRYAYILDGSRRMADPTLPVREKDDFGGENSILKVEERV